jgi:hypothetical protein
VYSLSMCLRPSSCVVWSLVYIYAAEVTLFVLLVAVLTFAYASFGAYVGACRSDGKKWTKRNRGSATTNKSRRRKW